VGKPALEADADAVLGLDQACRRVRGSHLILLVEVSFKGVETVCPEAAIGSSHFRGFGQPLGADAVNPPLRLGADRDQAGLPQHPQVLGHAGLAQLQPLDQISDRPLAIEQQIQDPPPRGLGQDLEMSVAAMGTSITKQLYA